jgi:hypothetical protein
MGSLFILSTTSLDFFQSSSGVTFLVKDYDAVGSNEVLEKVMIPLSTATLIWFPKLLPLLVRSTTKTVAFSSKRSSTLAQLPDND